MVKVYEHPLSPYAQKVKIALAEKGVPFETEIPPFVGGDLGQFRTLRARTLEKISNSKGVSAPCPDLLLSASTAPPVAP